MLILEKRQVGGRQAGGINQNNLTGDRCIGWPGRVNPFSDNDFLIFWANAERVHLLNTDTAQSYAGQDDRVVVGRFKDDLGSGVVESPAAVGRSGLLPFAIGNQADVTGNLDRIAMEAIGLSADAQGKGRADAGGD